MAIFLHIGIKCSWFKLVIQVANANKPLFLPFLCLLSQFYANSPTRINFRLAGSRFLCHLKPKESRKKLVRALFELNLSPVGLEATTLTSRPSLLRQSWGLSIEKFSTYESTQNFFCGEIIKERVCSEKKIPRQVSKWTLPGKIFFTWEQKFSHKKKSNELHAITQTQQP